MSDWIYKHRTSLLITYLVLSYLLHASNGLWVDDFWDHSAVITELMRNPWHPTHPQLAVDLPHTFFTPYSLLAALFAKTIGFSSVEVLSLLGLLNFGLLLYGLNLFIQTSKLQNPSATFFYSILLIIFLWGTNPWSYSGFFHYQILNFALPYPSAFATGLVFISLALQNLFLENKEYKYLVGLTILGAIVVLTHPVAFVFLSISIGSRAIIGRQKVSYISVISASTLFIGVVVAFLWPYYPLEELIKGASNVYHPSNAGVYEKILQVTWPILICVPFIYKIIFKQNYQAITITILLLLIVYVAAGNVEKYSYGRVISYAILLLQILIASKVAEWDVKIFNNSKIKKNTYIIIFIVGLIYLLPNFAAMTTRSLTAINSAYLGRKILNQQTFGQFEYLKNIVQPGDLVFANLYTSWIIPSAGAKVIAMQHKHAFVTDHEMRVVDTNKFFEESTVSQQRIYILNKYQPKYILLNKKQDVNWDQISKDLSSLDKYKLIHEDQSTQLYQKI